MGARWFSGGVVMVGLVVVATINDSCGGAMVATSVDGYGGEMVVVFEQELCGETSDEPEFKAFEANENEELAKSIDKEVKVHGGQEISTSANQDVKCLSAISETSWLWHRRLGHMHMEHLKDISSKELVRGLPKIKFEKDKYGL
ncbi:hypothetical protein RJ640_026045 [Escallonia rubra]|uniref:GAG-pre-integrase domain-containing protein n=1 Tax=Escallonia rubra TaxID=112253 RepID=A0AA88QMI3_9ASTE|nr:hypothetical protein RJ640_026045 [Escallonia rubra]